MPGSVQGVGPKKSELRTDFKVRPKTSIEQSINAPSEYSIKDTRFERYAGSKVRSGQKARPTATETDIVGGKNLSTSSLMHLLARVKSASLRIKILDQLSAKSKREAWQSIPAVVKALKKSCGAQTGGMPSDIKVMKHVARLDHVPEDQKRELIFQIKAIKLLGKLNAWKAWPAIAYAMQHNMHRAVTNQAIRTLADINAWHAGPQIIEMLSGLYTGSTRAEAAKALGRLKYWKAGKEMLAQTKIESYDSRFEAAMAMAFGNLKYTPAVYWLAETAAEWNRYESNAERPIWAPYVEPCEEPNSEPYQSAIKALKKMQKYAVPMLISRLPLNSKTTDKQRLDAILVLGNLRDVRAAKPLYEIVRGSRYSEKIQYAAAVAFNKIIVGQYVDVNWL